MPARVVSESRSEASDWHFNHSSWQRKWKWVYYTCLLVLLCVHCALLAYLAWCKSPNGNEPGHLVAGIYTWRFGQFDLYRVNPPLVRTIAAIPAASSDAVISSLPYRTEAGVRSEWPLAIEFVHDNGPQKLQRFITFGRWILIPLCVAGAYTCWLWATQLYGPKSGLLAAAIWCFSPNILAWGGTICPDAVSASVSVIAGYTFWRWLYRPNTCRAIVAGIFLGVALLAKTTLVVFFGLWMLLWAIWRVSQRNRTLSETERVTFVQLLIVLTTALYLLNCGYGFEGTLTPLGDFRFVSAMFAGDQRPRDVLRAGNRCDGSVLSRIPVPFPKAYLIGIDEQIRDFERKRWSYLQGEWRFGGWWYYYLYCLIVKAPLGTWLLVLMSLWLTISNPKYLETWRNELVLVAPIVAVFTLVSAQTGFNQHFRYVLPILPFAFIWISKTAQLVTIPLSKLGSIVVLGMLWSCCSSLWLFPHSMSYFNELVGGPRNGPFHLLHSNIDWGQDVSYLEQWIDEHPSARRIRCLCDNGNGTSAISFNSAAPPPKPAPGWYALSVNEIFGKSGKYDYFRRIKPVAMAGYSIYVYHIDLDTANQLRDEVNLPQTTVH